MSTDYIKQLTDAKKRKSAAALKAAYENSLAAIRASGAGVEEEYRQAKNTAAAQSAREGRNFNEYAAANGLNGGAAGQVELARSVTLQSGLNALDGEKAGKLAGLETEKAKAKSEYDAGLAEIEAEWESDLAQWRYEESVRRDEAEQEHSESLMQYGLQLLKSGVMPSDEMLTALGLSKQAARKYIAGLA